MLLMVGALLSSWSRVGARLASRLAAAAPPAYPSTLGSRRRSQNRWGLQRRAPAVYPRAHGERASVHAPAAGRSSSGWPTRAPGRDELRREAIRDAAERRSASSAGARSCSIRTRSSSARGSATTTGHAELPRLNLGERRPRRHQQPDDPGAQPRSGRRPQCRHRRRSRPVAALERHPRPVRRRRRDPLRRRRRPRAAGRSSCSGVTGPSRPFDVDDARLVRFASAPSLGTLAPPRNRHRRRGGRSRGTGDGRAAARSRGSGRSAPPRPRGRGSTSSIHVRGRRGAAPDLEPRRTVAGGRAAGRGGERPPRARGAHRRRPLGGGSTRPASTGPDGGIAVSVRPARAGTTCWRLVCTRHRAHAAGARAGRAGWVDGLDTKTIARRAPPLRAHHPGPPEVGVRKGRRPQPPRARLRRLRPGRVACAPARGAPSAAPDGIGSARFILLGLCGGCPDGPGSRPCRRSSAAADSSARAARPAARWPVR